MTTFNLTSNTLRIKHTPHSYELSLSYDDDNSRVAGTITSETGATIVAQTVTLTYTRKSTGAQSTTTVNTASDGTFNDPKTPNDGLYYVIATCDYKPTSGDTVPLTSEKLGFSNLKPGIQVKMIIDSVSKSIGLIDSSEDDKILIDYGDGKGPGKNFILKRHSDGWKIQPPVDFPVDNEKEWTVTFIYTDTIRYQTDWNDIKFASVKELIYAASNTRKSATYLMCKTDLRKIHDKCFESLPNCTSFNATFASCANLTSIPDDIFSYQENIFDMQRVFAGCTSLQSVPKGFLNQHIDTLIYAQYIFNSCYKLTGNVDDILTVTRGDSDRTIFLFNSFSYCYLLTGSGLTFLNRVPQILDSSHSTKEMFKYCTKLDDYADLPAYTK